MGSDRVGGESPTVFDVARETVDAINERYRTEGAISAADMMQALGALLLCVEALRPSA